MNIIVANQIKRLYDESPCSWSIEECLSVFSYYFEKYLYVMECDHPHMKNDTIQHIINSLDAIEDSFGRTYDLSPEDYPSIIDEYFNVEFSDYCNYSMAHFMSGDIRLIRCFELGIIP